MGKNSGSANYKLTEINRLLDLVEEFLPLGKDEWERLASDFNSTRPRSWVERDFDSLRRKFKALYSTRKPTGKANIPPHIERAKVLKRAIDDKANVVEMDDCADEDSDAESGGDDKDQEENRPIEPDFSFDYDPDDSLFPDRGEEGGGVAVGVDTHTGVSFSSLAGPAASTDTTEISAHLNEGAACANTQSPFDVRVGVEGLEAFAPPTQLATAPGKTSMRTLRSAGLREPKKAPIIKTAKSKSAKHKQGPRLDAREDSGPHGSNTMQSTSNRLGGGDLRAFRSLLESKRSTDDVGLESREASFAKAKRVRAVKATETLRQNMASIQSASSSLGGSMMEILLLLREENEAKADARRADEEKRRRDELSAREERYRVEKKEAEERRRQENADRDERARRDREDARARTQELAMLIGALTKKP